jgi:hypothetical protein
MEMAMPKFIAKWMNRHPCDTMIKILKLFLRITNIPESMFKLNGGL